MMAAFARVELRQRAPMLDLSLFRIPTMTPSLLASLFQGLASFAVLFLVIMYLQGPRGLSPIHASLLLLPRYVVGAAVGPFAGRVADRRGPGRPRPGRAPLPGPPPPLLPPPPPPPHPCVVRRRRPRHHLPP